MHITEGEGISSEEKLHPLFSTRMRNLSRFTAVEPTADGNSAKPESKNLRFCCLVF